MYPTTDFAQELSLEDRLRFDQWVVVFDESWTPNSLEEHAARLKAEAEPFATRVLAELAIVDLERQWAVGNMPLVEDYMMRFPQLGTLGSPPDDLIGAEVEARLCAGEALDESAWLRRFPTRVRELPKLLAAIKSEIQPAASIDTGSDGELRDTAVASRDGALSLPEVFGRYRILRELGRGAMGAVYLAEDAKLDRRVALKVPKFDSGRGEDQEFVGRFLEEARAGAKLKHDGLCTVFDVGEIDGVHCITMDYIEGQTLGEYLLQTGPLESREAARIAQLIANALQSAHQAGVIHRDLKPANVMLNQHGQPVVMDFGLARRLDLSPDGRLTQTGDMLGSPAYMSPEQVRADPHEIDHRTDISSSVFSCTRC